MQRVFNSKNKRDLFSRRGFITALALAGSYSASALSGCTTTPEQDASSEHVDATASQDPPSVDEQIEQILSSLPLEQKVSQLFIVAPEALVENNPVVAAGEATEQAFQNRPVGGICYFAQNLENPDQTKEMLANVATFSEEVVGIPPFLAVDEEGGTVTRIASNPNYGVSDVGDMCAIGAAGDTQAAWDAAAYIGNYLRDLGFNLDFAPVADIANNPESTTMTERSFGASADIVSSMTQAAVGGFLSTGILCSAKHFPGIGGAVGDSHTDTIVSNKTADEMAEEELLPFKAAIAAGVPFIMVGHLSCPAITRDNTPASLSTVVIQDLLRTQLGFDGIVITDSLGMGAVTSICTPQEIGVRALNAGNDMILMPEDFEAAYQGVLSALSDGSVTEERINQSLRRILRVKLTLEQ